MATKGTEKKCRDMMLWQGQTQKEIEVRVMFKSDKREKNRLFSWNFQALL